MLPDYRDVIVALSTAQGMGAIAVIRLSGDASHHIAGSCIHPAGSIQKAEPFKQYLIKIIDPKNNFVIDSALVSKRIAPKSYTGQNMVEFNIHGGNAVVTRVLSVLIEAGARQAEPGEFTLRAFLNGKIDLVQAEAVSQIISAESTAQLICAQQIFTGSFSLEINKLYKKLLNVASELEAFIEFPDEHLPEILPARLLEIINPIISQIEMLCCSFQIGKIVADGAKIVIAGRPNAGKSSLFNFLAGENKAIVSDEAGTTRDSIECQLGWNGFKIILTDTAGLRTEGGKIELIGVARTRKLIDEADAVIYVIDGSDQFTKEDIEETVRLNGRIVAIINKSDLNHAFKESEFLAASPGIPTIRCSVINGQGTEFLKNQVLHLLDLNNNETLNRSIVTNARHHSLLRKSLKFLLNSKATLESGLSVDFAIEDLNRSISSLGMILGRDVTEDMIENVFSRFCIGK